MPKIKLDLLSQRMLLVDWFTRLATEAGMDFNQRGSDKQAFTVGVQSAFHVIAHFIDVPPFLNFVASETARQREIDGIVADAVSRVEGGDFGGIVWHSGVLSDAGFKPSSFSLMGPIFQRLYSQQRISGWRRLGGHVLLEFVEEVAEAGTGKESPFAPKATVRVHIAVPGPREGHLSAHVANNLIETLAAICALALGRSVEFPHTVFPARHEAVSDLNSRRLDPEIGTLARKGVALDIFSLVALSGGFQVFERVRAALLTFDAAIRQDRDSIATILFVIVAECLTSPNAEWRREKLTRRFINFFDELMPEDLDRIIAHANFEEAFGVKRGTRTARALRRETLDSIYDYRSGQVHEGIGPRDYGFTVGGERGSLRRGLLLDFAETAIIRYLEAPRSTLIGHPGFESGPTQASNASNSAAASAGQREQPQSIRELFKLLLSSVITRFRRSRSA